MGLFPGVYNLLLKSLNCFFNKFRINSAGKTFLAGFISAYLAILIRPPKERSIWGVFAITRALDISYNSLIVNKKIPKIKFFYETLFTFLSMFTGYCFSFEPAVLPPSIDKFYRQFLDAG